ncbi:MAG: cytochrome c biogenesis protein CcsA [Limnochordales bacterium]|nr:cytochrome c biogenesis protein CcsA [Limnochordales bacterium]
MWRERRKASGLAAAFVSLAVAFYLALASSPVDRQLGEVQRLFYLHVSFAWIGLVLYALQSLFGLLYLSRRSIDWDRRAAATGSVSWLFGGLTLLTGMLFARPTWGAAWVWDARLISTLLLFWVETGYLLLRRSLAEEERRARLSAGLSLMGAIDLPVIFLSVRWWYSLHPQVVHLTRVEIAPPMLVALLAMVGGVSLLAGILWYLTFRVEEIERRWERTKAALRRVHERGG